MKLRTIALIALCTTFLLSCSKGKIIELPLSLQNGYGPFHFGIAMMSDFLVNENDTLGKSYINESEYFKGLLDVKYGNIESNGYQSDYQDYLLGTIAKERYDEIQKSWGWIPNTLYLSDTPVKTKIAFAYGKDHSGNPKIVIDANNNLDLNDDKVYTPVDLDLLFNEHLNKDSLVQAHSIHVSFESFIQNQIVPVTVPILVMYHSQLGFIFNFAQYATARCKGETIAVCWDGFTRMAYITTEITMVADMRKNEIAKEEDVILQNEYIEIKGEVYKNLGINTSKNALILEKVDLPKTQIVSTQVGCKSPSFEGEEFTNKSSISSEMLKGKYIFLDFWATWCGPCIQDIPNLKELYAQVDTSRIEIIGIVGDSPADMINEMINQHQITWPQIVSDDNNKITEKFGVGILKGYPTSFLLNPEGIIIAKNFRGEELVENVLARMKE